MNWVILVIMLVLVGYIFWQRHQIQGVSDFLPVQSIPSSNISKFDWEGI